MVKVICIKNTIEFEDDDFITSDLVTIGEIYESEPIIYYDNGKKSYDLWNVYIKSNTTDDVWSCPNGFFMDLDQWRSQQIDKIIEPKDLS
jgi:hypothetical protein